MKRHRLELSFLLSQIQKSWFFFDMSISGELNKCDHYKYLISLYSRFRSSWINILNTYLKRSVKRLNTASPTVIGCLILLFGLRELDLHWDSAWISVVTSCLLDKIESASVAGASTSIRCKHLRFLAWPDVPVIVSPSPRFYVNMLANQLIRCKRLRETILCSS